MTMFILVNSDNYDSFEEFINIIQFNKDKFSSTTKINLNSEYKPSLSYILNKYIVKQIKFFKFIKKSYCF